MTWVELCRFCSDVVAHGEGGDETFKVVCTNDGCWTADTLELERDKAIAEVERLRTLIRDLVHVGTGATPHLYDGLCPDEVEGYDTRNPNCRACAVLYRARGEGGE